MSSESHTLPKIGKISGQDKEPETSSTQSPLRNRRFSAELRYPWLYPPLESVRPFSARSEYAFLVSAEKESSDGSSQSSLHETPWSEFRRDRFSWSEIILSYDQNEGSGLSDPRLPPSLDPPQIAKVIESTDAELHDLYRQESTGSSSVGSLHTLNTASSHSSTPGFVLRQSKDQRIIRAEKRLEQTQNARKKPEYRNLVILHKAPQITPQPLTSSSYVCSEDPQSISTANKKQGNVVAIQKTVSIDTPILRASRRKYSSKSTESMRPRRSTNDLETKAVHKEGSDIFQDSTQAYKQKDRGQSHPSASETNTDLGRPASKGSIPSPSPKKDKSWWKPQNALGTSSFATNTFSTNAFGARSPSPMTSRSQGNSPGVHDGYDGGRVYSPCEIPSPVATPVTSPQRNPSSKRFFRRWSRRPQSIIGDAESVSPGVNEPINGYFNLRSRRSRNSKLMFSNGAIPDSLTPTGSGDEEVRHKRVDPTEWSDMGTPENIDIGGYFFHKQIETYIPTSVLPGKPSRCTPPSLPESRVGSNNFGFNFPGHSAQSHHWNSDTILMPQTPAADMANIADPFASVHIEEVEKEEVETPQPPAATSPAEEFEWNTTEHLAGSPLCPLHPKHKSGGRGICVYHGRRKTRQFDPDAFDSAVEAVSEHKNENKDSMRSCSV